MKVLPKDDSTRDIDEWRLNQFILTDEATLAADFDITESNGVYEDTGLSIELPTAGKYLVWVDIRGVVDVATNPPGWITVKLYDATNGEYITDSERLVVDSSA